jgi:predicted nucleic acid-binding protein
VIVVDASVAVKWVVEETLRKEALAVLDSGVPLIAPDLLLPEFANVMRRKLRSQQIIQEQVDAGLQFVRNTISQFIPSEQLVEDALVLADQLDHSPYDCMYLACALSRGRLLSADSKFLEKCRSKGFGSVVLGLLDISDVRFEAMTVKSSVGSDVLADIGRLAPLINETFDHLREIAENRVLRDPKLMPFFDVNVGFQSPAYLSLSRQLEQLAENQIATLLALGWLGRSHQNGQDWSHLLQSAKDWHRSNEFHQYKPYIMGQMSTVLAGLAKLRAHYNLTD